MIASSRNAAPPVDQLCRTAYTNAGSPAFSGATVCTGIRSSPSCPTRKKIRPIEAAGARPRTWFWRPLHERASIRWDGSTRTTTGPWGSTVATYEAIVRATSPLSFLFARLVRRSRFGDTTSTLSEITMKAARLARRGPIRVRLPVASAVVEPSATNETPTMPSPQSAARGRMLASARCPGNEGSATATSPPTRETVIHASPSSVSARDRGPANLRAATIPMKASTLVRDTHSPTTPVIRARRSPYSEIPSSMLVKPSTLVPIAPKITTATTAAAKSSASTNEHGGSSHHRLP